MVNKLTVPLSSNLLLKYTPPFSAKDLKYHNRTKYHIARKEKLLSAKLSYKSIPGNLFAEKLLIKQPETSLEIIFHGDL